MAAVSTIKTYNVSKSIREDLANIIYNISPTLTPFMNNVGRDTADSTYTEWQTDSLAAPNTNNAVVEGADAGDTDFTPTNRVANYLQISNKVVSASGTSSAVDTAGMSTVLAYEQAKKAKELKRDMEAILLSNQAAAAGNTTTARKLAGLPAWLRTNAVENGLTPPTMSGGVSNPDDGYPNAGWTGAASAVAFTEDMLKDAIQNVWAQGGDPKVLMVGPHNKRVASTFAGLAEQRVTYNQVAPLKIIATADVYLSDFGEVAIVPNRFQPDNFAFVLDPNFAKVSYLRSFQTIDIAKTGDSTKKELLVEYTLKVATEKAHAVIANLTTS